MKTKVFPSGLKLAQRKTLELLENAPLRVITPGAVESEVFAHLTRTPKESAKSVLSELHKKGILERQGRNGYRLTAEIRKTVLKALGEIAENPPEEQTEGEEELENEENTSSDLEENEEKTDSES